MAEHRAGFSNAVLDALIAGTAWTRDIPAAVLTEVFPVADEHGNLLVTPAREGRKENREELSALGRGAPVFDAWNADTGELLSFKCSREARNPRNIILTTGTLYREMNLPENRIPVPDGEDPQEFFLRVKRTEHRAVLDEGVVRIPAWRGRVEGHILGVLRAVRNFGTKIPVRALNYNPETEEWWGLSVSASDVLRDNQPTVADGRRGNPTTLSVARRASGHDAFGQQTYIDYTSLRLNIKPLEEMGYTTGWKRIARPTL